MKPNILILCTGNSARSQIAEGILRSAAGDLVEVHSAGTQPTGRVNPNAIAVMNEIGIDISHHTSKHMTTFLGRPMMTVITVCGNADQACPIFPGQVYRHHWAFTDPSDVAGDPVVVMEAFRDTRDEIKRVFEGYAAGLREGRTLEKN